MGVAFRQGQQLGREDLDINFTDESGYPTNVASVTYATYLVLNRVEYLIGDPARVPINASVGTYYASLIISSGMQIGDYVIRWAVKRYVNSPLTEVIQEFAVVGDTAALSAGTYTANTLALISSLRILTRDNNPDRNYHFRPPMGEGVISAQNRVFGQIWEDAELVEYMVMGLDLINMWPPETFIPSIDQLVRGKRSWRTLLLTAGAYQSLFALTANWVEEEFDFSIGGISLNIEKSSKYQGLLDNSQQQFEKFIEAAKRSVKITRGLRQSRFGYGIRSAFGPTTGAGVMTPSKFVSLF